jgi:hypothetical protein
MNCVSVSLEYLVLGVSSYDENQEQIFRKQCLELSWEFRGSKSTMSRDLSRAAGLLLTAQRKDVTERPRCYIGIFKPLKFHTVEICQG